MSPTIRTMLVPDLDNDLLHVLNELEELLLTYSVWENTGQVEPGKLPAPLAGGAALEAPRRLATVLAPTQGERAIKAGTTGRLLAPMALRVRAAAPGRRRPGRRSGPGRRGPGARRPARARARARRPGAGTQTKYAGDGQPAWEKGPLPLSGQYTGSATPQAGAERTS